MKRILLVLTLFSATLAANAQSKDTTVYALSVAFNSIGTGVPSDQPLRDYISAFKKKNNLATFDVVRIGPLGKEGEYKLLFPLKNLTIKQKRLFLSKIPSVADKMSERGSVAVLVREKIVAADYTGRTSLTKEQW